MKLSDLMDMKLFHRMVEEKFVRVNSEPNGLKILNYTEKAQYDNEWNEVTKQCRGLVIDSKFNVVARPFDKFLNYGQNQADILLMDHAVEVTDKMDGSLGILFYYKGGWHTATRGSFVSEQSYQMEGMLYDKYDDMELDLSWTYLFEIIYPGNRVVLDYGNTCALYLLGARHIESGVVRPAAAVSEWTGPKIQTFPYKTLREALAAPNRPNAEGFVVYFPELDYRVKIKQDDYVALHKIVTGLTPRRIWESMREGKSLEDILNLVPDEWHEWTRNVYFDIDTDLRGINRKCGDYFVYLASASNRIYAEGKEWEPKLHRKYFAEIIKDHPYKGLLFMLLDGNAEKLRLACYDLVKPAAE